MYAVNGRWNKMSETITDIQTGSFIEKKCCIEHEGKKFCSGGSWLCQRVDTGKFVGILYGDWNKKIISSWDGSLKIPAYYSSHDFRNNFGAECCTVHFKWNDHYFYGRWSGMEWSQIIRVREITEKSYRRNVGRYGW
jgi:hypothetical protein